MDKDEALEIFNGAMLSDAGLRKPGVNAHLEMALSGQEHLDWLYSCRSALSHLGVPIAPKYPVVRCRVYKGKEYDYCLLVTRVSQFLTEQYEAWYPSGAKVVPYSTVLTPRVIANWFMGDGSSSRKTRECVPVWLCTAGFPLGSIFILEVQLHHLGFKTGRSFNKECRLVPGITVSIRQDSVNDFMDAVKPYVLPSYMYKVKYRH